MAVVFHGPQARRAVKLRRAREFHAAHPDLVTDPQDAWAFLDYIFTPPDGSWAYLPSGKTGTTSTLAFLHHLQTGHPLSARLQEKNGMNPDQAAHELHRAQVFCFLLSRGDRTGPDTYLKRTLKLATVRDPMARAISGFTYLCRADEKGLEQFYTERARMTALTGFDWERHPHTAEGFERFLDYLRIDLEHHADRPVDSHFRPQVLNIRPDLYKPDLVGRCEDLAGFFRQIAERLERPVPEGALTSEPRNRSRREDVFPITLAARQRMSEIFRADYESFAALA